MRDDGLPGSGSVGNPAERIPWSRPHGIDASNLLFVDRIGERSRADAVNVATAIDQAASGFDRQFGARMPRDMIASFIPILNVPCHRVGKGRTRLGEAQLSRYTYFDANLSDSPLGTVSSD